MVLEYGTIIDGVVYKAGEKNPDTCAAEYQTEDEPERLNELPPLDEPPKKGKRNG